MVDGESGRVMNMTVLLWRAVVNSVRPGRTDDDPLRSATRTVIPKAEPILDTREPDLMLVFWLGRKSRKSSDNSRLR